MLKVKDTVKVIAATTGIIQNMKLKKVIQNGLKIRGETMKELRVKAILYLRMKDGESEDSAKERIQKILYKNGIECSYFIYSVEDDNE